MTPFEYISSKVYTKVQPSNIQGVGLFALKSIPKGIFPFEKWEGETAFYPIELEQINSLPEGLRHHIRDLFSFGPNYPSDKRIYIQLVNGCHWIFTSPYYFVNSGGENSNLDKSSYLTLRKINRGEEILSNYGKYEKLPSKELI